MQQVNKTKQRSEMKEKTLHGHYKNRNWTTEHQKIDSLDEWEHVQN